MMNYGTLEEVTEFQHKDGHYRIKKMNAFEQLALAQRLTPLIVPFLQMAMSLQGTNADDIMKELGGLTNSVGKLAEVLQKMPSNVTDEIFHTCMRHLTRMDESTNKYVPIFNDATGTIFFPDIEGYDVLVLSVEVIKDQLGNFITGLNSTLGK